MIKVQVIHSASWSSKSVLAKNNIAMASRFTISLLMCVLLSLATARPITIDGGDIRILPYGNMWSLIFVHV